MAKLDRKICIIGGGASGLAVLKALRDTEHFRSGKWQITVLERRAGVGGTWFVYRTPMSSAIVVAHRDALTKKTN